MPWALDELALPDLYSMPAEAVSHESLFESPEPQRDTPARAMDFADVQADAYARGRADGEAATRQQAEASVASALLVLADAVQSVRMHEARWTSNAEENVAALAIMVARHLVQREVESDPMIVRSLVQRALAEFPIDQIITVRLNPADLAICSAVVLADAAGRTRDVRWIAEQHILRGGCLVEGRERIIDGRIDTSLERAYRAIGQVQA